MRTIRAILVVAATLVLGACSDILGPWGASGLYGLRTANSQPVPAVVFSREGDRTYTVTLTGGELRLRGDNSFRMDLDYIERDGREETRYTQGISGQWERDHETVWLDYVDPDTGEWTSLAGFQRHYQLELTIPGAVYGSTVRTVFER